MSNASSASAIPAYRQDSENYLYTRGQARFALTVFFVLMLFDFMDRQVIASLLPAIKAEWQLSDTQLGLAVGVVNVAIAMFAFPAALIADRWSRTKSSAWMAIVWSLATAACAMAGSFTALLIFRFLVGAGEAGYSAPGSSVLAAHYPKSKRTTAISIFQGAGPIGSVLGVVLGGIIAAKLGWRYAFGLVAIPGLLFALLLFWVKDYPNAQAVSAKSTATQTIQMPWYEYVTQVLLQPVMWLILLGSAFQFLVVATLANWLPSYFGRVYQLPLDKAGLHTGIFILLSAIGMMLGGWLTDRFAGKQPVLRLMLMAVFCGLCGLMLITGFSVGPGSVQKALLFAGGLMMVAFVGPIVTVLQDAVPQAMHSTTLGIWVTFNNVFGMALGPLAAGILSDQSSLQSALLTMSFIALAAAALFALAMPVYRKALA